MHDREVSRLRNILLVVWTGTSGGQESMPDDVRALVAAEVTRAPNPLPLAPPAIPYSDLPDDWYVDHTGESRVLDQDKVAAGIARLRDALSGERQKHKTPPGGAERG